MTVSTEKTSLLSGINSDLECGGVRLNLLQTVLNIRLSKHGTRQRPQNGGKNQPSHSAPQ